MERGEPLARRLRLFVVARPRSDRIGKRDARAPGRQGSACDERGTTEAIVRAHAVPARKLHVRQGFQHLTCDSTVIRRVGKAKRAHAAVVLIRWTTAWARFA